MTLNFGYHRENVLFQESTEHRQYKHQPETDNKYMLDFIYTYTLMMQSWQTDV